MSPRPTALNLWQFHTDWDNPDNSTFTGPVTLQTADFQLANSVPQKDVAQQLGQPG